MILRDELECSKLHSWEILWPIRTFRRETDIQDIRGNCLRIPLYVLFFLLSDPGELKYNRREE